MPYTPMVEINPDLIRKHQYESGKTNRQISKAMGVSPATYDRWKAKGEIPRKYYEDFCRLLDIPVVADPPLAMDKQHSDKLTLLLAEVRMLRSDLTMLINMIGKE